MNKVRHNGFTIIELMIALLVLGVLLAVGVPGFRDLIQNNRILSDVYAMRAALNKARSEALAQRAPVIFCPSNDGETCAGSWDEGYIAFVDFDDDGAVDDPNDPDGDRLVVSKVIDADHLDNFSYSGGANLRFDSRGFARNSSGTFTVCDDRGVERGDAAKGRRGVIVTLGGSVTAADPNDLVCP